MKTQYPIIRKLLLRMAVLDQVMRRGKEWDRAVDEKNSEKLKKIIARIGWPTIPKVGPRASHAAWLIAQHADHDRKFQRQCLERMKTEVAKNTILPQEIAYLSDRILVHEGKPQRYGTQFRFSAGHGLEPFPINNPKKLRQFRREIGLEPFSVYKKRMKKNSRNLKKKAVAARHGHRL